MKTCSSANGSLHFFVEVDLKPSVGRKNQLRAPKISARIPIGKLLLPPRLWRVGEVFEGMGATLDELKIPRTRRVIYCFFIRDELNGVRLRADNRFSSRGTSDHTQIRICVFSLGLTSIGR